MLWGWKKNSLFRVKVIKIKKTKRIIPHGPIEEEIAWEFYNIIFQSLVKLTIIFHLKDLWEVLKK